MAKPNYSFEKRQREIAKKKKKEEKRLKKAEAKNIPSQDAELPGNSDNITDNTGDLQQFDVNRLTIRLRFCELERKSTELIITQ